MRIGVPTEIKADEYRVALTPAGVRELTGRGHEVVVQAGAGVGSKIADEAYAAQGALIAPGAADVFERSELIVKVKEPQAEEVSLLGPEHVLLTYLHLAATPQLARGLMDCGATCIAYETIEDAGGRLPLLAPMSEVAGKLASQAGAFMLGSPMGGRGTLMGGTAGVPPAKVMILGAGVVGVNAARIAIGLGAQTMIFDRSLETLRTVDSQLHGLAASCYSSALAIEDELPEVDLVIGAVLIHGAKAPRLISREQLGLMRDQAVVVDVSIDQGGCFETSRPTTHSAPTYEVDGVLHYCVANMPGAVPTTSTYALTNATMPYVIAYAEAGMAALDRDPGFMRGLNVRAGQITHEGVAEAVGVEAVAPHEALAA